MLEQWIFEAQQGFLAGRSMPVTIVGVETCPQLNSLKYRRGGILLLDFKAAFPSISQKFLIKMLKPLGLPKCVINVVKTCQGRAGGGR